VLQVKQFKNPYVLNAQIVIPVPLMEREESIKTMTYAINHHGSLLVFIPSGFLPEFIPSGFLPSQE
jgi:hypothetical protein